MPSVMSFDDLPHTEHAHEFVGAEHGDVPFSIILVHAAPGSPAPDRDPRRGRLRHRAGRPACNGTGQGGGGGGFSVAARLARLRCSRRRSRAEPLVACISTASTPATRPHGGMLR
jgi:hypothetical protein